jgi:hypothetical protein
VPQGKDVTFLCSFSAGLEDLPKNKRGNRKAILSVLKETKRFSVFEATFSPKLAQTLDALLGEGLLIRKGGDYPWIDVELSPEALALLEG